jgi:uncharacterized peroxidase-related enzyme
MTSTDKPDLNPNSWLRVGFPELTDETRGVFERSMEKFGYVPFPKEVVAHKPDILIAQEALSRAVNLDPSSNLTPKERELMALVVSAINKCEGCIMSHASRLRAITGDPYWVGRVEINYRKAPMSARERALAQFAAKATGTPQDMGPEDLEALRGHGLSETDLIEVAGIIAYFNFSNRMNNMLGIAPNPAAYASNR